MSTTTTETETTRTNTETVTEEAPRTATFVGFTGKPDKKGQGSAED